MLFRSGSHAPIVQKRNRKTAYPVSSRIQASRLRPLLCESINLYPDLATTLYIPRRGIAITSKPRRLTTVIWRATLLAVGLNEFEISQRRSSVSTADRAIVEENVRAAILRARFCVGG